MSDRVKGLTFTLNFNLVIMFSTMVGDGDYLKKDFLNLCCIKYRMINTLAYKLSRHNKKLKLIN